MRGERRAGSAIGWMLAVVVAAAMLVLAVVGYAIAWLISLVRPE